MGETYTISDFLKGAVRGFTPSDEALKNICLGAGIESPTAEYDELTTKQQRVALAYLYIWIATGPTSSSKWSEKDGDWSQSGGGETLSPSQIRMYLRMADAILKEYGLDTTGIGKWRMRAGGFRNIRNYGRGRHI